MCHDTSHIWPKNCIPYISLVKLVFDQLFTKVGSVGPALPLEAANRHLSALGAARAFFDYMHGDVHIIQNIFTIWHGSNRVGGSSDLSSPR